VRPVPLASHNGELPKRLVAAFADRFGRSPDIVRAPGRINLIGDHTDYNDGFVLPAALQFTTWAAAASRRDRTVTVESLTHRRSSAFNLDDPAPRPRHNWSDYVRGVVISLRRNGVELLGTDIVVDSDIPVGAGLSSSAALEVSTALALATVARSAVDPKVLALAGQWSENHFVGVRTGIMDQYTACFARGGHALLLDCRSLTARQVAIPNSAKFVVANTMTRRALAAGEYNTRREQCEAAVAQLSRSEPNVSSLRDVDLDALMRHAASLPTVIFRRAHHVVTENARTVAAAAALESGDLDEAGALMNLSHESLRDDFEVSSPELDTMVSIARSLEGVHGARMTGGGFGGCAIALVDDSAAERVAESLASRYSEATGVEPTVFVAHPSDGASVAFVEGRAPR
jgi:galactokinase